MRKQGEDPGFVYVLSSPSCPAIKIGGTAVGPLERLKSINGTEPYGDHGPWRIVDYIQVTDWRFVEAHLHSRFCDRRFQDVPSARELFIVAANEAQNALMEVGDALLRDRKKIEDLFRSRALAIFLEALFAATGLRNWLHAQGAWTFSLFPSTAGGKRFFTLNIGQHEVAYAVQNSSRSGSSHFAIVMDELIRDFPDVLNWLQNRNGIIESTHYKTALPRAVTVTFDTDVSGAADLFSLSGVRRAIAAYWTEALIDWTHRDSLSPYARYHNYNAVAAICRQMDGGSLARIGN